MGYDARRNLPLDLLRAAAVALVFLAHMPATEGYGALGDALLARARRSGPVGLDLFFVLSGFLVSGLLFRELTRHGSVAVGRFLVRRGLKIYPAFYVFLAALVAERAVRTGAVPWTRVASEALFVQNYFPSLISHTWSLAVEEHFYLAVPFVIVGLARRPSGLRLLPVIYAVSALATLALRWRVAATSEFTHGTHLAPTHLRFDALLLGVVLARVYATRRDAFLAFARRLRLPLLGAGAVGLALRAVTEPQGTFDLTLGVLLRSWCMAALLVGALGTELRPGPVLRAIAFVGSHSYSVYLWHITTRHWWDELAERATGHVLTPWLRLAVFFAGSIGVGVLLSLLVEFPVIRIRDRVFPSRSGGALEAPEPRQEPGPEPERANPAAP